MVLVDLTSQADIAQRAAQLGISTQELARQEACTAGGGSWFTGTTRQGWRSSATCRHRLWLNQERAPVRSATWLWHIFGDQMARMQGAAGGLDRTTRGAFGDALSAFQAGQQGARAGAQGIAGLGQQGFDMLTGQIRNPWWVRRGRVGHTAART